MGQQLKPLEKRMNKHQRQRRQDRIAARRSVRTTQPLRRGFWGRLKWLLTGK